MYRDTFLELQKIEDLVAFLRDEFQHVSFPFDASADNGIPYFCNAANDRTHNFSSIKRKIDFSATKFVGSNVQIESIRILHLPLPAA